MKKLTSSLILGIALILGAQLASAQEMSFFVTSEGLGNGGDLGGIEGADAHCQALAEAAGAGGRDWRAYLSGEPTSGAERPSISARTRIGDGPWHNADGVMIAGDVDELHISPNLSAATALTENGDRVNGFGTSPNRHDILTGTQADGTAFFPDDADHTCNNWTSSSDGNAQVGHSDRHGGGNTSWNSAHASRSCSQPDLQATGGDGLLYCFAAD